MRLSREEKLQLTREACEADLITYIKTVAPYRMLGAIHEELIGWWERQDARENQLVLLPRAHQKSQLVAFRTAWRLTKNPALQILYVSATSDLAEEQLGLIKNILESPKHQLLWPELINKDEGKRAQWTNTAIRVDHPLRKAEGVRDPSIKAAGLTTNITGFHANIVVLDDVVVPGNAYTMDGREKVAKMYSQLASIEEPGAEEWVVGTRYHPADLYAELLEMEEPIYDEHGEIIEYQKVYEIFQRVVEVEGEFLWPRQRRKDGKYYGFDLKELARIKAKYVDKTQFFAQYYNDPNDPDNARVSPDHFQYYDKKHLKQDGGEWFFKGERIRVFAGMDFAFSQHKKADYSTIAVIGIAASGDIYILDLARFKTDRISTYFDELLTLYNRWQFKKLRAEVSVAQQVIVRDLKDNYIRPNGLPLVVDEYRPNRHEGSKEERQNATLLPRYDNMSIWHYRGGNCQLLEDELLASKPEHDDLTDAVTAAIDIAVPPMRQSRRERSHNIIYDSRFGGVAFR